MTFTQRVDLYGSRVAAWLDRHEHKMAWALGSFGVAFLIFTVVRLVVYGD